MRGIELSRKYYEECGKQMLQKKFEYILPKLAVGLVGSGSECYGYDDVVSQDHDFEPGFCIFVPDDIDSKTEFELERAYAKLPKEFSGYFRSKLNPIGGNRHGVIKTGDFYKRYTGSRTGFDNLMEWFYVPEYYLAEAVNGEIFIDNYGEFSSIRKSLSYYPDDVRTKKLAGYLLIMGQAGQYNYKRCIDHNQKGAAQLAVIRFAEASMSVVFLLNKKYMPYYKWSFKALSELELLSHLGSDFEYLISSSNDDGDIENKMNVIENICEEISDELKRQFACDIPGCEMEKLAYSINNCVVDGNIRNENILFAVN